MTERDRLYDLLPAIFRERDVSTGQLRALMAVLELQYAALAGNIDDLYANLFVETCADWLIPYFAAQVGVSGLTDPGLLFAEQRALVGRAIAWRRRKGVLAVLQPRIRAASGWYAAATEPEQGRVEVALCRLPVFAAGPAPAPACPAQGGPSRRYSFDPLGLPCALYTVPLAPPPLDRTAPDASLPLPITRARLAADLAAYAAANAAIPRPLRPADSALYGPVRGLTVALDGVMVAPDGLVTMDLSGGEPAPAAWPLFVSGALDGVPTLPRTPEVAVTIGSDGPHVLALDGDPATLAEIAAALEKAVRAASATPAFAAATAVAIADAIVVLPGGPVPLDVAFAATTHDPTTAAALKLTAPSPVLAVRSGALVPFPRLAASGTLALTLHVGAVTIAVALPLPIADVAAFAAALQAAILGPRKALPLARVLVVDDRVLVLPDAVAAAPKHPLVVTFDDTPVARRLRLANLVALDPEQGFVALPFSGAAPTVTVCYGYAFPWAIGGGPYDRPAAPRPGARVYDVGAAAPYASLADALVAWQVDRPAAAIIRLADAMIIPADALAIDLAAAQSLTVEAAPQLCAALVAAGAISLGGAAGSRLALSGLRIAGALAVTGPLALDLADCAVVPPAACPAIGASATSGVTLRLARCITGSIVMPAGNELVVEDSIVGGVGMLARLLWAIAGDAHGMHPGPMLTARRATVLGPVRVAAIPLAEDVLFVGPAIAGATRGGSARNTYLPNWWSALPQAFCQPLRALRQAAAELDIPLERLPAAVVAAIEQAMRPRFAGGAYPNAGFARLADTNAPEILAGGSRGAEIGAFGAARAAQRLVQAQRVIAEGLPLGTTAETHNLT